MMAYMSYQHPLFVGASSSDDSGDEDYQYDLESSVTDSEDTAEPLDIAPTTDDQISSFTTPSLSPVVNIVNEHEEKIRMEAAMALTVLSVSPGSPASAIASPPSPIIVIDDDFDDLSYHRYDYT
jgi:hypothetical protein